MANPGFTRVEFTIASETTQLEIDLSVYNHHLIHVHATGELPVLLTLTHPNTQALLNDQPLSFQIGFSTDEAYGELFLDSSDLHSGFNLPFAGVNAAQVHGWPVYQTNELYLPCLQTNRHMAFRSYVDPALPRLALLAMGHLGTDLYDWPRIDI